MAVISEQEKRRFVIDWLKSNVAESYQYWYMHCREKDKPYYNAFLNAAVNLETECLVDMRDGAAAMRGPYLCIQDNPILFFAEDVTFRMQEQQTKLMFKITYSIDDLYDILNRMDGALTRLAKRCEGKSVLEKERIVHDCILKQVIYSKNPAHPIHKAYSVFMYKAGVCDAISKAVKIMLNHVGVQALVVESDARVPELSPSSNAGHAWNMVCLNGRYYHLDVTFDNTLMQGSRNYRYDYFNLTDEQIKGEHVLLDDFPKALDDKRMDYYTLTKKIYPNGQPLRDYIITEAKKKAPYITFQIADSDKHLNKDTIIDTVTDALATAQYRKVTYLGYNEKRQLFFIYLPMNERE